jgi:hypothetical protein
MKVTNTADPAALIEWRAHSAYFTEVMKVTRDKAKTRSKTAREACRGGIFWNRWPWSQNLSFALRSQVKYSRLESLHRNENKEKPFKRRRAAWATQNNEKRERGKEAKDRIRNRSQHGANMGQGEEVSLIL